MKLDVLDKLSPEQTRNVRALIQEATEADGVSPVSEHVLLQLRHPASGDQRHVLVRDSDGSEELGGSLLAYGHLDLDDPLSATAELAVSPSQRRRGVGGLMLDTLIAESPAGELQLWAHGEQAPAGHLARTRGFDIERVLIQMRRSLHAPLRSCPLPEDVTLRPFRVGEDEAGWLEVNARAFSALPDQGRMTREDLAKRMGERWFDPEGFLIAESGGRIVGFHWTKVHPEDRLSPEALGEVYVLGIDPAHHGRGLGRALTVAGLSHLRSRGLFTAMLYVDQANSAALRLYQSLGFAQWDVDVLYRRSAAPGVGSDSPAANS